MKTLPPVLVTPDKIEQLSFDSGLDIELHEGRAWLTIGATTFYALLTERVEA